MTEGAKYVWAVLLIAVLTHLAVIHAAPRVMMAVAIDRIGAGAANQWRLGDRVTPLSRTIVRPSPDFAYSACAFDLSRGDVAIEVAPWMDYWSLSLYAANSDNFFVIDDREARAGAEVRLVRRAEPDDAGGARIIESPTDRGIALIRRLAPTPEAYNRAAEVARNDVCAAITS